MGVLFIRVPNTIVHNSLGDVFNNKNHIMFSNNKRYTGWSFFFYKLPCIKEETRINAKLSFYLRRELKRI